jgi:hypothetical protein
MVILTPIERATLQVFFYIFDRCSMCPPLVIQQTSMRYSISFHRRVSISRSKVILVTTVSYRQIRTPMCASFSFKKTWKGSLSFGVRITMICRVVYFLRIFKLVHGIMNSPVHCIFRSNYMNGWKL